MKVIQFKILRVYIKIKSLFDLKNDFDFKSTRELIVNGIEFKSGNAWSLIFAIIIASIGLYANSNAVIIGAMLISPLMGPIVGTGFSLATHDFDLLKKSVKNLIYAVLISIGTSTFFFLVSPSTFGQSELLARTQPTIFDVLIAFFGGAAGIVANSRLIKGNAVPGVAIATALMPPLCTVGFGIANMQLNYILGAFYLFSINAVFILISTYLFTQILGFELKEAKTHSRSKQIHKYMWIGSILLIIPSVIMAWYLHKKNQFINEVEVLINQSFKFEKTVVVKYNTEFRIDKSKINLYLIGEKISEESNRKIRNMLNNNKRIGLTHLEINYLNSNERFLNNLEEKFVTKSELYQFINFANSFKKNIDLSLVQDLKSKLDKKLASSIKNIHYSEKRIYVQWNKKPTHLDRLEAQNKIYQIIYDQKYEIEHSVSIPD